MSSCCHGRAWAGASTEVPSSPNHSVAQDELKNRQAGDILWIGTGCLPGASIKARFLWNCPSAKNKTWPDAAVLLVLHVQGSEVWVLLVQFESNLNRHTVIPVMTELKHVTLLSLVWHSGATKLWHQILKILHSLSWELCFQDHFSFLNGGQGCSVMNTESCCLSSLLLQRQKCTSEICRMHNCFLCWQCQLILIYVNESTDCCNEDMNLRTQYCSAWQLQILVLILLLPSCLAHFVTSFHPYVVSYSDYKWKLVFLNIRHFSVMFRSFSPVLRHK